MTFYSSTTATAAKLLLKFGQSITLTFETGGTIDPATGVVTTAKTVTTVTGNGAPIKFKNREVDGTVVKSSDVKLILESVSPPPTQDWRATIKGVEYRVMEVDPVSPGGIDVIYILQLRV